ncbi:MAG TPA: DUF1592 domain-containing protein [Isosphaeraceae bacterium]|nr:DUF1592 domain-containing protein [Isosphaeraceae bacterium]
MIGSLPPRRPSLALVCLVTLATVPVARADDADAFGPIAAEYGREVRPIVERYCLKCHSTDAMEGDLDLERFARLEDVRRAPKVWVKVAEMLDNGEMPPKGAKKPSAEQKGRLRGWVGRYLKAEAFASAGDPGPVVLRRLNNAQYTYTVRDLTGLEQLQPAREFPADGAAGEGFTNTGNALVMSPSLLSKYLDAGKAIAAHAVLLPDGFRFAPGTTRRDWSDELLGKIKGIYARYADAEGRLPLEKYLAATIDERGALASGAKSIEAVAAARGLNARYLAALWGVLNDKTPSLVLDTLRARWRDAKPGDAPAIVAEVGRWQQALATFQKVGHVKPWVVSLNPVVNARELRFKLPDAAAGPEVTVYLAAGDAGDDVTGDDVVWQRPRLVSPGRPDLPLRALRAFARDLFDRRDRAFASAAKCLAAAVEARAGDEIDRDELARRHGVEVDVLSAWLDCLGIGPGAPIRLDLFREKIDKSSNFDFVKGWGSPETPNLVANSSDRHVRIPGNMKPHGLAMHPSPTLYVAVGWLSPVAGNLRVVGKVTHAHPECGNGVTWSLEVRRGATRRRLASGTAQGSNGVAIGPVESLAVRPGDLVSVLIGPRDGNHACDLTDVELSLKEDGENGHEWNLTRDVSGDILAGNPHADRFGHDRVWHFYKEPVRGNDSGTVIPSGSVLARWLSAPDDESRHKLAAEVQALLTSGPPASKDDPNAVLYRQLSSMNGPLLARFKPGDRGPVAKLATVEKATAWGLDPARFGVHPDNSTEVDPESLCDRAPSVIEIKLPADLVAGSELVTTAVLHAKTGGHGSVQPRIQGEPPADVTTLRADTPILVGNEPAARARVERAFEEFRRVFPPALCYARIVPVDEVITLTLFHREDEPLRRLMLSDAEAAELDRHWDELHWVAGDALTQVDAFAQLMEYATQDADPRVFEPLRKPIHDRAADYRKALVAAEPRQVDALIRVAPLAYRRPLTEAEANGLRTLYQDLRREELPHDEAFRLTLARVFVAPAFLYRIEQAGPGKDAVPVSDWELASRLSDFLWSSLPDEELRELAASGRLHNPDVLAAQARRMLRDPKVRRLATEFACQWLHVYDFDSLDEKSERHFPTFAALRGDMYEETIRFFTDISRRDLSILTIFDADHTFLNEALAKHYGIPGVTGPEWRRVEGIHRYGRGGILGLSTTLAKQSGASRTSPILRGNWLSEALLGERLPRPPKDVPKLPEDEGAGDLTVRQLVEKHTSDPRCATCHVRIDPFGYALERFDAIGRRRDRDLGGHPIDTRTKLQDGIELDGLDGLRHYLLTTRRDAVLRQFCRKLLGYSLGRAVQLSDEPLLDELKTKLEANDYRFSVAIETIVLSRQFREIRGKESAVAEVP